MRPLQPISGKLRGSDDRQRVPGMRERAVADRTRFASGMFDVIAVAVLTLIGLDALEHLRVSAIEHCA